MSSVAKMNFFIPDFNTVAAGCPIYHRRIEELLASQRAAPRRSKMRELRPMVARLFLVFVAGAGARTTDRQAVRGMANARVSVRLDGRRRRSVCRGGLRVRDWRCSTKRPCRRENSPPTPAAAGRSPCSARRRGTAQGSLIRAVPYQ